MPRNKAQTGTAVKAVYGGYVTNTRKNTSPASTTGKTPKDRTFAFKALSGQHTAMNTAMDRKVATGSSSYPKNVLKDPSKPTGRVSPR